MKKQTLTKEKIIHNPKLLLNKFDISSFKFYYTKESYKQIIYCYKVVDKIIKCVMYYQHGEQIYIYFEEYNFDNERDIKIYFEDFEDIIFV